MSQVGGAIIGCMCGAIAGMVMTIFLMGYIEKQPGNMKCTEWTMPSTKNNLLRPECTNYHYTISNVAMPEDK